MRRNNSACGRSKHWYLFLLFISYCCCRFRRVLIVSCRSCDNCFLLFRCVIIASCRLGVYGVEVRTIVYDFSDANSYSTIEDQLKDLDIGILGTQFNSISCVLQILTMIDNT